MSTTLIRQIENELETGVQLVDEEYEIYRTWDDVFLTCYEVNGALYVEFVDHDMAAPLSKARIAYDLICDEIKAGVRLI